MRFLKPVSPKNPVSAARVLDRNLQIPAIALTAYAGETNQQQALAAGFQRHLPKPVDPETLVQTIEQLLHQIDIIHQR
jgi:CheY-like chemotaxis protein